ncbi:MAG TPA: hypothetical protein VD971_10395 [Phycisphaerales bacterium]|nr:hypothetical protein [Phycisphaerales bacterium]
MSDTVDKKKLYIAVGIGAVALIVVGWQVYSMLDNSAPTAQSAEEKALLEKQEAIAAEAAKNEQPAQPTPEPASRPPRGAPAPR